MNVAKEELSVVLAASCLPAVSVNKAHATDFIVAEAVAAELMADPLPDALRKVAQFMMRKYPNDADTLARAACLEQLAIDVADLLNDRDEPAALTH